MIAASVEEVSVENSCAEEPPVDAEETINSPTCSLTQEEQVVTLRPDEGTNFTAEQRAHLDELLEKHVHTFNQRGEPPTYTEHRIETEDNSTPYSGPPYVKGRRRVKILKKEKLYSKERMKTPNIENSQDSRKEVADRHRTAPTFKPGDQVLVKAHFLSSAAKGTMSKFEPRRDGPYVICSAKGPATYMIATPQEPTKPIGQFHVSDLTPFRGSNTSSPVHPIRPRGRPRKPSVSSSRETPSHHHSYGRS